MIEFDAAYHIQPFKTLGESYADETIYPRKHFRVEWGPIFHRGRLDGSACILIIGQDPAQHENIARRILVGEAGQRIQGFLAKLGIERSYVMINTYLYSVYGSAPAKVRKDPRLIGYRNHWFDALLIGQKVEAVVALGMLAEEAWQAWQKTPVGQQVNLQFLRITHPTQPESSSKGDKTKLKQATQKMLAQWNTALQKLDQVIQHPDIQRPLTLYGDSFKPEEKLPIPDFDLPAGLPVWMRSEDNWARRVGASDKEKRANITIKVPKKYIE